ncbi:DUF2207 domain-containing protein [Cellulomonas hominis]
MTVLRRVLAAGGALGTLTMLGLLGAPAAGAAVPGVALRTTVGDLSDGQEITRYAADVTLGADGVAHVVLDFDFDFGDDPGHGPYLTLPTRQNVDAEHDRLFRVSDISASSSTGAPADVDEEDDGSALILRIGDPDVDDVSGVQTYSVSYTVDGWVNPSSPDHSGDELFWNVIGNGWTIPLSNLAVQVTGPADVQDAVCFTGPYGSDTPCDSAQVDGATVTYTQSTVPVGDQLTTVAGWPGGTFPGVEPILVAKDDLTAPLRPVSPFGAVGAAVLLGGSALAVRRVRRTGRDRAYLGLTPGLRPGIGQDGASGYRDSRTPVAVQFTPPQGVRPGEVGTLVDERADPVDVTATLIDLAVRGYLRIDEVQRSRPGKKAKDWTLVQLTAPDASLLPFETTLLTEVFDGRSTVKLSELKTTFAASMGRVQDGLYEHVTTNGWFRANPKNVRAAWVAAGLALAVLGALGTVFVFAVGWQVRGLALVPVAVGLVGLLVAALSRSAPARTETGTAVLAEALGFRRYLATAEADQIRFEEGEDIFSRYLPYAIVFGLTERWARVFGELAAQGRGVAQPGWYVGGFPGANVYWAVAFASSLDRFQAVATESLSAPTPGSSGGSGFGGGGFSGGGVGGGGGGGW